MQLQIFRSKPIASAPTARPAWHHSLKECVALLRLVCNGFVECFAYVGPELWDSLLVQPKTNLLHSHEVKTLKSRHRWQPSSHIHAVAWWCEPNNFSLVKELTTVQYDSISSSTNINIASWILLAKTKHARTRCTSDHKCFPKWWSSSTSLRACHAVTHDHICTRRPLLRHSCTNVLSLRDFQHQSAMHSMQAKLSSLLPGSHACQLTKHFNNLQALGPRRC